MRTNRPVATALLGCVLALVVTGCGETDRDPRALPPGATSAGATSAGPVPEGYVPAGYTGRLRGSGTVLESAEHGPQLCFSVMESMPPQCGGIDLTDWDWAAVPSREQGGVRWAHSVQVTGTWSAGALELTEPPTAVADAATVPPAPDLRTRCPTPEGGWRPTDPALATEEARMAAMELATADPAYAGGWIDQSYLPEGAPPEQANDPTRYVLNLQFTSDIEAQESQVRRVWGGALCVTQAEPAHADLLRIREELIGTSGGTPAADDAEPDYWSTSVNELDNRVDVVAMIAWWEQQQALDERYGAGTVQLAGWLTPLD